MGPSYFIDAGNVFWLVVGASLLHVFEEYSGGFVDMMRKYGPFRGMTKGLFIAVNSVFVLLCVVAALVNVVFAFYSLSIAALIFVNALIHVGGAVRVRGYAAGLITAVFLYFPLSVGAYLLYGQAGLLDPPTFVLSVVLGLGWMLLALLPALTISRQKNIRNQGTR